VESAAKQWTVHDRVVAILEGTRPDRLPFVDRLEIWYENKKRTGTLSKEFKGMSLAEVHAAVGMGQEKFVQPYALRFRGVKVMCSFEGETFYREVDPVVEYFPALQLSDLVVRDKAGVTVVEFITPVGRLTLRYEMLDEMIVSGIEPYPKEHLIKDESDYQIVEYILERAEFVPQYEKVLEEKARLGGHGFVVPYLRKIPFQELLLGYVGEIALFYALHDSLTLVKRLMAVLDQLLTEILRRLAKLPVLYVEFADNLDGVMTNPRLFEEYCLPYYQRYAEILHGQGKKVGSHTDGNLRPLLSLLAESGLDVCESFSPAPLTECTFEEAWNAWQNGPIIWGGIPSSILEERTSESEFRDYIERLLETIGGGPIILGVGDMVMGNSLIKRVRYIADRVEDHVVGG